MLDYHTPKATNAQKATIIHKEKLGSLGASRRLPMTGMFLLFLFSLITLSCIRKDMADQ